MLLRIKEFCSCEMYLLYKYHFIQYLNTVVIYLNYEGSIRYLPIAVICFGNSIYDCSTVLVMPISKVW